MECQNFEQKLATPTFAEIRRSQAGLPDFSWDNIPKRERIYQKDYKITKCQ
jgi:hypothetical protein